MSISLPLKPFLHSQIVSPSSPEISTAAASPTAIIIKFANSTSTVDEYEVEWERDTSGACLDVDEGNTTIIGTLTNYTITGLEEDSSYTITVTAVNTAGSNISQTIVHTEEAGKN